jgi:hypothetical protein
MRKRKMRESRGIRQEKEYESDKKDYIRGR